MILAVASDCSSLLCLWGDFFSKTFFSKITKCEDFLLRNSFYIIDSYQGGRCCSWDGRIFKIFNEAVWPAGLYYLPA